MIINNIAIKSFKIKKNSRQIKKEFNLLIFNYKKNVLSTLSKNYKNNFSSEILKKLKKKNYFRIIGMGGSILGAKAIYGFFKKKN